MRWRLEFYREHQGTLARYSVEAPTADAAQVKGRRALLADYPPEAAPQRRSLFQRAQRLGGQDADGWVLYRIANE